MAKKNITKRTPKRPPKKAKAVAKRGKSTRIVARTRVAAKPKTKKQVAAKKPAAGNAAKEPQPLDTLIIDTVEEPVPGVVVITEYEATVRQRNSRR